MVTITREAIRISRLPAGSESVYAVPFGKTKRKWVLNMAGCEDDDVECIRDELGAFAIHMQYWFFANGIPFNKDQFTLHYEGGDITVEDTILNMIPSDKM